MTKVLPVRASRRSTANPSIGMAQLGNFFTSQHHNFEIAHGSNLLFAIEQE
jgi:hypothetical protein